MREKIIIRVKTMNRIKNLRLENDLSQRRLAEKVGCSQKSIDCWEKDVAEPTAGFICALADTFECSTDYVLGREDEFGNVSVTKNLPQEQEKLLSLYAKLSPENKKQLKKFAEFLEEQQNMH